MFRLLGALFAVWMLVGQVLAQDFSWSHQYEADSTAIARDSATGDIYVVSIDNLGGFVHPVVDRYSANGTLLARKDISVGSGIFNSSRVLDAQFRNGKLYAIYGASRNSPSAGFTYLATYDSATNSLAQNDLLYQGKGISASCATIGQSTYFLGGYVTDLTLGVGQVRELSGNAVLKEHTTSTREIEASFLKGTDTYVTSGLPFVSSSYYIAIHRFSSTTHSATYALSALVGTVIAALSNDENYLFTGIKVFNSGGFEYDYHVRAIDLTTNIFQSTFSAVGPTSDDLRALGPVGASNVAAVGSNAILGLTPTGSTIFNVALPFGYEARTINDAGGNLLAWVTANYDNDTVVLRLDELGNVRNKATFPNVQMVPDGLTIDAAGIVRSVYHIRRLTWDKDRYVAQLNPATLTLPGPYTVGGDTLIGTISIGDPAPAGGATFDLQSSHAAAIVPATMTIPQGQSSGTFVINTTPVATNVKPTINARYDGLVLQSNFDLAAPLVRLVTATPQSQYGGNNITGAVHLTGKAPAGGKVVTLSSSNTAKATVPASTTIAAGSTGKSFIITTFPTLINASSVITATTGAVSKTVFVAIVAPILQSATLASSSITGGTGTTMTVTLGSKAPSGYTVTLLSGSSAFVQLPSSFAVPANTTTANIPVLTSAVTTSIPVTLVAYRGPYVKTMTLTLTP